MEELVRYIAQNLVDDPSAVAVETREEGDTVVISLSVAPADMGKVIGRQGRIAKAIRPADVSTLARTRLSAGTSSLPCSIS